MAKIKNKKKSSRLSNVVAFIVSILAAIGLFFYVKAFDTTMSTRSMEIKVDVIGEEELASRNGFALPGELDLILDVTVSGRRSDLNSLKVADISVFVDVSGVNKAGENTLPVNVKLPNGISLAKPLASINLFLDTYQIKSVPVVPSHTVGSFVPGVYIGSEVCNPSVITVSGPTSVLSDISHAVASYSVAELSGNVVAHCAPELFTADGSAVKNPYVSLAEVDVVVSLETYSIKTLPVNAVYTPDGTVIPLGEVEVRGNVEAVAALDEIKIGFDESDFESSAIKDHSVASMLPNGVALTADSKKVFSLSRRQMNISASDISFSSPNVFSQGSLKLEIFGRSDIVSSLYISDFSASVDASGLYSDDEGNLYAKVSVTCGKENIIFIYDDTLNCTVTPVTEG